MHIEVVLEHPAARLPTYGSELATGADLYSCEGITIGAGEVAVVATGIRIAAAGYEAQGECVDIQIRPRSGLAAKFGVTVLNTPGTIDADYRGEVKVILINHSKVPYVIKKGDRIAQIVVAEYLGCEFVEVDELEDTARGDGRFGSSGR